VADRGERQRLVFGLIHRLGGAITSRDMVEVFGLTQGGAATELNRYRVQGFLRREREPGLGPPTYVYSLTRMGLTKANWWIKQAELLHPPEQGHLPGLEPEPESESESERGIRPATRLRGSERGIRPQTRLRGD